MSTHCIILCDNFYYSHNLRSISYLIWLLRTLPQNLILDHHMQAGAAVVRVVTTYHMKMCTHVEIGMGLYDTDMECECIIKTQEEQ